MSAQQESPGPTPQSPGSRGLRAGVVAACIAVLVAFSANDSWLLPALDADGVAWTRAAQALAAGKAPILPVGPWFGTSPTSELASRGAVVPRLLAAVMDTGVRVRVAGLWFAVASLGALALAMGWVAGGAAGTVGGLLAALLLVASPLGSEVATVLGVDALLAALVVGQLGVAAYRPRQALLPGLLAAAAWALSPVGLGAVAAVLVWPWVPRLGAGDWPGGPAGPPVPPKRSRRALVSATPALLLLGLGPVFSWLPSPRPGRVGGMGAVLDGERVFPVPSLWEALALGLLAVGVLGAIVEARATRPVLSALRWDHPRAPDLVAARLRSAAWPMALALLLATAAAGEGGGDLSRPWLPFLAVLATGVGAAAVRWVRRPTGWTRWGVAAAVGLWLCAGAGGAWMEAKEAQAEGRGLTSEVWLESEVVRWLDNQLPQGTPVYASQPFGVVVQTGLAAFTLPPPDAALAEFGAAFQARPGAIVLTGPDTLRAPRFEQELDATPLVRDGLGVLLVPPVWTRP